MRYALAIATLLTLLAANPARGQQQAVVVTDRAWPERCISPVVIREIDGEPVNVSHRSFELAPGVHTLHGMADINTAYCPVPGDGRGPGVPPLVAEFEAGKTYYVGLDHAADERGDWRIAVWRIEQGGAVLMQAGDLPGSGNP